MRATIGARASPRSIRRICNSMASRREAARCSMVQLRSDAGYDTAGEGGDMNLIALASHTVDLDLLPECPMVLDVGCRDFDFTRALLALRPVTCMIALDPS